MWRYQKDKNFVMMMKPILSCTNTPDAVPKENLHNKEKFPHLNYVTI